MGFNRRTAVVRLVLGNQDELERVQSMVWGASSIASNTYRRTRPLRGFPTEIMGQTLEKVRKYREWIARTRFPVRLDHLNAAIDALVDAILEFRRTGGVFEPATYHGGADPSSAEHLYQFAHFLHRRINQPLVYGAQWAGFGHEWDAFIEDLQVGLQRWRREHGLGDAS
jgi:hypothetical protein